VFDIKMTSLKIEFYMESVFIRTTDLTPLLFLNPQAYLLMTIAKAKDRDL